MTFLNVYQPKMRLIKVLSFLDSFKLYRTLLLNLQSEGSRKLFLAKNHFKTCSVKLWCLLWFYRPSNLSFSWKNTVKQYFKSLNDKINSLEPTIPVISSVWSLQVTLLTNVIYFSFGLSDDQKSFNAACSHILFPFLSSHYGFLDYCKMFSFLSFNNTLGRAPTCQILSLIDIYLN